VKRVWLSPDDAKQLPDMALLLAPCSHIIYILVKTTAKKQFPEPKGVQWWSSRKAWHSSRVRQGANRPSQLCAQRHRLRRNALGLRLLHALRLRSWQTKFTWQGGDSGARRRLGQRLIFLMLRQEKKAVSFLFVEVTIFCLSVSECVHFPRFLPREHMPPYLRSKKKVTRFLLIFFSKKSAQSLKLCNEQERMNFF
jgi:hypothetical protein